MRYVEELEHPSTFRVHRSSLVDPDVYRMERQHLFSTVWLYVGHTSEVKAPGDFRTRTVGGRPLLMSRGDDGQVHVMYNTCPHRGAEVCREKEGSTNTFRCFYHAWTFDRGGALISVPDRESYPDGFFDGHQGYDLVRPAQVDDYRGFVFVCYSQDGPSLADYLADAKAYLDLVCDQAETEMEIIGGTHEYAVAANWKLLAENSADGYHAGPVHSTWIAYSKSRGDRPLPSPQQISRGDLPRSMAVDLGNGHAATVKRAVWGRPVARWVPSMGEHAKPLIEAKRRRLVERHGEERADEICELDFNMVIFPNLVVNNIMSTLVRTFDPVSERAMTVTGWAMGPEEESDEERALRLDSYLSFFGPGGLATPDDVEALESVQRGLAAAPAAPWSDESRGLDKDVSTSADEMQMRVWWRQWQRVMEGVG